MDANINSKLSIRDIESLVANYLLLRSECKYDSSKLMRLGLLQARFQFYHRLSQKLKEINETEESEMFMDRAFDLWNGEAGFIDGYLKSLNLKRNIDRFRIASRRAGVFELEKGNIPKALYFFNLSQYAVPFNGGGDAYQYDYEILTAIDSIPQNNTFNNFENKTADEKIKIAYLIHGADQKNSVLIRLLMDYVRYHDNEKFDIKFFSCNIKSEQRERSQLQFYSLGAELIVSESYDDEICLIETESKIRNFSANLLVGVALLADYRNYYLFSRFPYSRKIALCFGPPAQYIPPSVDFAIGATWHPILDSPVDSAVVEIEATLPVRPQEMPSLPKELERLPQQAIVILAAGRSEKFNNINYWLAIIAVLDNSPDSYFIAVGLIQRPDFLDELLKKALVQDRIIMVGWVDNYREYVLRADIVVDTFPSGGGLTVLDAMAFGIPVISFEDNYKMPFDQTNWNLGEELLPTNELILPRDDLGKLTELIISLVRSPTKRSMYGDLCQKYVQRTRGNPARMVARIEGVYQELLNNKRKGAVKQLPTCISCNSGLITKYGIKILYDFKRVKNYCFNFFLRRIKFMNK